MPSDKTVIALRVTPEEEKFIDEIAVELGIPRSRVLGLAIRVFRERLANDAETQKSPSEKRIRSVLSSR